MRSLLAEVRRRDPILFAAGWLWIALLAVAAGLSLVDPRTILGIDPWIKPMKFLISFVVYSWTLAWLFGYLQGPRRLLGLVRWGIVISLAIEILCIGLQSARGVPSHFNIGTLFDGVVFGLMGTMILVNTLLVMVLLALFSRQRLALDAASLWGIRLGLVLFLLGSFEAFAMIFQGAHTVGRPDGGPGLPFLNWSAKAGDLRAAHFLWLHGLQAVPFGAFLIHRWFGERPVAWRTGAVFLLAALYAGIGVLVLLGALDGRPLLAL